MDKYQAHTIENILRGVIFLGIILISAHYDNYWLLLFLIPLVMRVEYNG